MGSVWFLVFHSLLVAASSLAIVSRADGKVYPHAQSHISAASAKYEAVMNGIYSVLEKNEVEEALSLVQEQEAAQESITLPVQFTKSLGLSNYYVTIGIGSPAKYYKLTIDTGSVVTWLQCQPCYSCYRQTDPIFDPSQSTTHKSFSCTSRECSLANDTKGCDTSCAGDDSCMYKINYYESSSAGTLRQDVLTTSPSQILPRFLFGCGHNNKAGTAIDTTAGILGLGYGGLSFSGQLSSKYGYYFSVCLPRRNGGSASAGFLTLGGATSSSSAFTFTPLITNPKETNVYLVKLTGIKVAGELIPVPAESYKKIRTFIDTGFPSSQFPSSLYTPLRDAFKKAMSNKFQISRRGFKGLDTCYVGNLGSITTADVPNVSLLFEGGVELTLGAHNILIQDNVIRDNMCLAFTDSIFRGKGDTVALIGNYQLQTYNVAFDISNSRVGFASGGCS